MSRILKVMLVSPIPPPSGGISTWTAAVLPRFKAYSDIEVIHVDTAVRWRPANDISVSKRLIGGSLQAIRDLYRIYWKMLHTRPHVLHLCTSGSLATPRDLMILGMARRNHVRSIIHYRMGRLPALLARNNWEWRLTKRTMRLADTVLLLDNESISLVEESLPQVVTQSIPNPVDLEVFDKMLSERIPESQSSELRRIVFVGHIFPSKGTIELVTACSLLDRTAVQLQLVGEVQNEHKRELVRIAKQREDGRWLEFTGELEWRAAMRYIRDADLFVLPSHTEGFPNVVLEAMALGKPIVATRVGAIPAMLDENSEHPCGVLIPPQDVHALSDALAYLLSHPEIAQLYGARAREKVRAAYSMDIVLGQYISLWHSMADLEG